MKKTLAIVFTVLVIASLCVSITACGGGVEGTYKFSSMKMDMGGVTITIEADKPATIAGTEVTIKADAITLTVNKDNTFEMKGEIMGESASQKGTWENKDGKLLLTAEGEAIEATIDGNTLTLSMDGQTITFKK